MPPVLVPAALSAAAGLAAEKIGWRLRAWVPPPRPPPLVVSGRPFLPPTVPRGRAVPLALPRLRGDRRR